MQPGLPASLYVVEDNLELLILLPQFPSADPVSVVLGTPRASCNTKQSLYQLHIPSSLGHCSCLMSYVRAKQVQEGT